LVIKAMRMWGSSKSFALNVLQQIKDGRRPGASVASNCLTNLGCSSACCE
jgi:hypothetical protein